MPKLDTTYLGLKLANPLVASAIPMTYTVEGVKALEKAGVGAIVISSIFEEQIRADVSDMVEALEDDMSPQALAYLQADLPMRFGPERYLDRVREIRKETKLPLIASINCIHTAQWMAFARKIQATGVDALELNVYDVPDDPFESGSSIEERHLQVVQSVLAEVTIPVAVKISPFYSSLLNFGRRLDKLGVAGIVVFNRFFQPDIDINKLELRNRPNLSRPESIRLPLRWVAILRPMINCNLALTGGVHNSEGAVQALLAGADAVCMASAMIKRGSAQPVAETLEGLRKWMAEHNFADLDSFRGSMAEKDLTDRQGFERAHYVKMLSDF